jgi:hypothetical protein
MFTGFILGAAFVSIVVWVVSFVWSVKQIHKLNENQTWANEQNDALWRAIRDREEELRRALDTRCDMIDRSIDERCSCSGNCGRASAE